MQGNQNLSGGGLIGKLWKGKVDPNAVHTGGNDKEEQKASFNLAKAECKTPRQTKRGQETK